MSAQSSGLLIPVDDTPVAPPRRCKNKDLYSNTATSSSLAACVSTHPRVKRSTSQTTTSSPHNYSCSVKTVSLERTRSKGLPPSPVVRQPVRNCRTTSPATIPRLPTKRLSQLSVQKLSDVSTERIPNLPANRIPRLPPKKKKEASYLNSGILNPLNKTGTALEENSNLDSNESSVPDYEDIEPASAPELIKVAEKKDNKTCCNSLPRKLVLEVIEESSPQQLSLLNHFNTVPKLPSHGPPIPRKHRSPPERTGVPTVPRKSRPPKQTELSCFTSCSRYLDLSDMKHILPSITGACHTEDRKPSSTPRSFSADDANKDRKPISKYHSSDPSFSADDANEDRKPISKYHSSDPSFSADDANEDRKPINKYHSSYPTFSADDANKDRKPICKYHSSDPSFSADDANEDRKPINKYHSSDPTLTDDANEDRKPINKYQSSDPTLTDDANEDRKPINKYQSSASSFLTDGTSKERKPISKCQSFLEDDTNKDRKLSSEGHSFLADDTNDIDLLHDDSYEPDFGHLVLLQGGVEAIHAALSARKEKRSAQKSAITVTEKSQLAIETDNKLDDAGYEVPASEDKNSSNDSDPTYEEVTFRCREGKPRTERTATCCGKPSALVSMLAAACRSCCCVCDCRLKATSYRFTKGSTWDWHPSEIPKTTKGSRSSKFVSRVRTTKKR